MKYTYDEFLRTLPKMKPPRMVECESCIGSGKIREEAETPERDRWRPCMDCTGTGQVPAKR